MKKKSFWKRCNRGFIVSMVLLVGVIVYVTVTQILLAGEKQEIREVANQIQTLLAETQKTPVADAQAAQKDLTKTAAFKDTAKKQLSPLFVKDAAYLDDSAQQFVYQLYDLANEERTLTRMEAKKPHFSIKIDEETASVSMDTEYAAAGKWYDYDGTSDEPVLKDRTGTLDTGWSASFVKENGEWKLYRITDLYAYTYEGEVW